MHQAAHPAAARTPRCPSARTPLCGLLAAALLAGLLLSGCGRDAATPPADRPAPVHHHDAPPQRQQSERGDFELRELVTGLEHPWGLAFLPDGGMLVTERPGRLRRIDADGGVSAPLTGVPTVFSPGQSGLLDVALSPAFADDRWVYLAYGEPNWRGNKGGTAVARGRLEADGLVDVEVVFRQEPKLSNGTHLGARLLFDDDGLLFVSAGDNRASATAQQLDHLQGKVVRIAADGGIPADNPYLGRENARPEIFSYGHRNAQGMAMHPLTREIWLHEHGPKGGDEINVLRAGANYGWPLLTFGLDYSGQPVPEATGSSAPGMQAPIHYWPVSPAVSGMAFYTGDRFAHWRGNLFVGALATRELIRLELDGERIVHEERLLADRSERIRDVRQGPDGLLYLLTDDANGTLLQLAPAADRADADHTSAAPTAK